MKVLVTGTSQGIGKAIAEMFLAKGHNVVGIDRQRGSIIHANYIHHQVDVRDYQNLPQIGGVEIPTTLWPFAKNISAMALPIP